MAVIVHNDMPVDLALRMLWREASRELVIETLKEGRYYVKPTSRRHEANKVYSKMKRRRGARRRKFENRGWLAA